MLISEVWERYRAAFLTSAPLSNNYYVLFNQIINPLGSKLEATDKLRL